MSLVSMFKGSHRLLFILTLVFLAKPVSADLVFTPTFSYVNLESKDSNTTPEDKTITTKTYIDVRLGYLMPTGIYLGGIYGIENTSITEDSTKTTHAETRYGPSLGFVMGSFNLIGHYFLSGTKSVKSPSATIDYTGGSGFQIDMGWMFSVTPMISFGPQITYRTLNYTKKKTVTSGVTTETTKTYTKTDTLPYLAFWFMF